VTLAWSLVAFAKAYHVQIEKAEQAPPVLDVTTDKLALTHLLEPRTKYRWRVATTEDPHLWTGWVGFETP
jgi:hypothetical protein